MRGGRLVCAALILLAPKSLFVHWYPFRAPRVSLRVQSNPYDVLGLERSSSYDDIRGAFRKLARTYHPDVPGAFSRTLSMSLQARGTKSASDRSVRHVNQLFQSLFQSMLNQLLNHSLHRFHAA